MDDPAKEVSGNTTAEAERREEAAWWDEYDRARAIFVAEHYEAAAAAFEALRLKAKTPELRRLALEFQGVSQALAGQHEAQRPDEQRTSDELSLLYSTAFVYGFGSSAWLALQTQPQSFAGAVLPFALITTGSVGAVAVADDYRPFPRGVPHAIVAGSYLGALEGVWIVGLQHANATRRDDGSRFSSPEVATVVWASATSGAIAGAAIGVVEQPTPGQSSFATSTAFWLGSVSALLAASFEEDSNRRGELAFGAAGAGLNLGLALGAISAARVDPSVARSRLIDLGGMAGALVSAGTYAVVARDEASVQTGFGVAALGASAGLGLVWWLSAGMPSGSTPPALHRPLESQGRWWAPSLLPSDGGFVLGVTGSLP